MATMLKKAVILLIVAGFLMLATLVPGLGLFGAFVAVIIMAFDTMDYSFDHFTYPFRKIIAFLRSHFLEIVGFAGGLGLTTAIPVINMALMPGSVVAGAFLVAELIQRSSVERPHS